MKTSAATGKGAAAAPATGSARDESTRDRVARSILTNGPSSAAVLAERLELTPAAVRRHLDHLLDEGLVESREERVYGPRGRGRPAKVFVLTDSGRHAFHQAYDDLAATALQFIAEAGGDEAVAEFARRRAVEVGQRYRELIDAAPDSDKADALAQALTGDGYAASTAVQGQGTQLCQHHCPVAHVAEQFPQLCEAETEVFATLLGRHVQRLATIAHGDGVCTTHIPGPAPVSSVSDGESARTAR
ncbi:helix-turn-helix transcriptional regulator [Kribbella sp. NPDC051587]|uniref:helix-turn-helix transcriptional regulator n=1 Tax=Kribbella sp. NPDC051587 TaxID=3364119 RepID=UPI0037874AE4